MVLGFDADVEGVGADTGTETVAGGGVVAAAVVLDAVVLWT